jgi:hypothetical protein
MQLTQLGVVITALALALAVLVWRGRIRRLNGENPEDRYRRDIHAVRVDARFGPPNAALEMSGQPARSRTPRSRGPKRPLPG